MDTLARCEDWELNNLRCSEPCGSILVVMEQFVLRLVSEHNVSFAIKYNKHISFNKILFQILMFYVFNFRTK